MEEGFFPIIFIKYNFKTLMCNVLWNIFFFSHISVPIPIEIAGVVEYRYFIHYLWVQIRLTLHCCCTYSDIIIRMI